MLPIVQTPEGLTAREIFNKIIKGQVVRIHNDPVLANQLKNHLSVIKSREKKLFASLGLDFVSSIISVTEHKEIPNRKFDSQELILSETVGYDIKLVAPKQRRRYPVFLIEPDVSTG